jgi:threonine/homoserine/homoserine lactone efflux protein
VFETLFNNKALGAFVLASLILAVSPGPGVIFVVTQTLRQGRSAGIASVAGVAAGNLMNACAASLGLAVLFAASAAAFVTVKIAGAAYLIYLGVRALLSASRSVSEPSIRRRSRLQIFREGLTVAVLNPKTALFFAALIPQFIDTAHPPLAQSVLLGAVFVLVAACTDTLYVLSASALSSKLSGQSRWRPAGRYISAAAFFSLGLYAAFGTPRSTK